MHLKGSVVARATAVTLATPQVCSGQGTESRKMIITPLQG